jgi:hypothetical protein
MARYNTSLSTNSTVVSSGSTVATPNAGNFTQITGGAGTVIIPDPVQYYGITQTFYNAGSGAITLQIPVASASAFFKGPGQVGNSQSLSLPTLTSVMLASDGASYLVVGISGGPLTATTGSISQLLTLSQSTGNDLLIQSNTDSTSSTTGSLQTLGGIGVGKSISSGLNATVAGRIYLQGSTSGYVSLQAPATPASITWTLPAADAAAANYSLVSNGSGTLSFINASPLVTQTVSAGTYYPVFTNTANAAIMTDARTQTSGLTFDPSVNNLVVNGTINSYRTDTGTSPYTTSYTLALTDRDKAITFNNSAAVTVTVPTNASVAFPIGSIIYITRLQSSTASVTLSAAGGVTINKSGALGLGEELILRKRATDTWVVFDQYYPTTTGGTQTTSAQFTVNAFYGSGTFIVG